MSAYIETGTDAAFAIWLATRDAHTVLAERTHPMVKDERKILRYHVAQIPRTPAPAPVERTFTDRQMEIAVAAMANRASKNNAAEVAEMSN